MQSKSKPFEENSKEAYALQNPVKYPRWSVMRKFFNYFLKKLHLNCIGSVLNTPLPLFDYTTVLTQRARKERGFLKRTNFT